MKVIRIALRVLIRIGAVLAVLVAAGGSGGLVASGIRGGRGWWGVWLPG